MDDQYLDTTQRVRSRVKRLSWGTCHGGHARIYPSISLPAPVSLNAPSDRWVANRRLELNQAKKSEWTVSRLGVVIDRLLSMGAALSGVPSGSDISVRSDLAFNIS